MAERLYFKMWHSWWTSESHEDLEEDPLAIGPVLMSFCRWTPGEDYGWAITEKGNPVTCAALARRARWTGKGAGERVAAALRKLESVGTAELRSDGAWGLPKFGRWQETADAAKKRKQRDKGGTSAGTVPQMSPKCPALEEERDEDEEESPPDPPRDPDPLDLAAKRIVAYLNAALVSLGEPGKFSSTENIRARLADGNDEETLMLVIDHRADECRSKPASLAYLNTKTPFLPKNWERTVAFARSWARNRRPTAPRNDTTAADLRRERDARRAQVELEERQRAGGDS